MIKDCIVYRGTSKEPKKLDTDSNLSKIRNEMSGFMQNRDLFVYFDKRQKKQLTQPKDSESDYKLQEVLGENNQITILDPAAEKPDLEGTLVQWFTDRNLQVSINLNQNNDDAKNANKGKFAPFLLKDVQAIKDASDEFANVFFKAAVICEKGSAIRFNMSCWASAGWGLSIESDREKIVPMDSPLYWNNHGRYGETIFGSIDRYKQAKNNIVVDSLREQGIPGSDKLQYSKVTVTVWNMSKYKQDGTTYSSDLKPPFRRGEAPAGMTIKDGVIVPGDGVESGSPHASGSSTSTFGSISNIQEDKSMVLGRIELYFLVFVDRAAAEQMVQQNNLVIPY